MLNENYYVEPAREIPVYGSYDVIVVGGGVAGLSAAIAAGRNKARTLIIERFPYFGGTATASLMANIVGFRNQVEPNELQTTKGLGEEIILRLLAMEGAVRSKNAYPSRPRSDKKGDLSYSYCIDTEKFKYLTLQMIEEAGVEVLFHTWFCRAILAESAVKGIIVENKSGRQAIYAKTVIDCSGDGDVAYSAGAGFWQTRKDEAKRLNDCLMYKIAGFNPETKMNGSLINNTMVLWGPGPGPADGTDARELTRAEITSRLAVYADLAEKKKQNPDLDKATIIDTGSLLGIRQTRFIDGDYQLTGDDVLGGVRFPDVVAMAANPVISYYGYRRFLEHEGYQIPYRCLLPRGIERLLIAGRCMSSDQVAFESWRAMAHIFALGEAAGTAAALATRDDINPREIDIEQLQEMLQEQGAELG